MKPGDVLLTTMPQADGTQKARPVLFLCQVPPFNDFLVCGITTRLDNAVAQLDEVVTPSDEDFETSGLKSASLIRTAYLALLPAPRFRGRIGSVAEVRHKRLLHALAAFLQKSM
ncbi:MAG: type II toxin-antitoxin system PemK/MazF family toxin [Planctomycetia bacterium]